MLGELVNQKPEKAPALVLVGRTAVFPAASTFEKIPTSEFLDRSVEFERRASDFGVTQEALREAALGAVARRLALFPTRYADIQRHLKSESTRVDEASESGQTLSRLLDGMVVTLENIQPRHSRPVTRKRAT